MIRKVRYTRIVFDTLTKHRCFEETTYWFHEEDSKFVTEEPSTFPWLFHLAFEINYLAEGYTVAKQAKTQNRRNEAVLIMQ